MRTKIMITTLLAASIMLSCNPKEILEPTITYPAFVVIDGDTVKTRDDKAKDKLFVNKHSIFGTRYPIVGDTFMIYKEVKLLKPSKLDKLDKLKNQSDSDLKNKPFRMVAIGGAVAAGFRDGGWFNEGMLTSYPNLIANQMGISYDLPLFESGDYNGSERKVFTSFNPTGGSVPKVKSVSNNSGVVSYQKDESGNIKLKLKPYSKSTDSYVSPIDKTYRRISESNNKKLVFEEMKKGKKFDFFILEATDFGGVLQQSEITQNTVSSLKIRDWKKFPDDGFQEFHGNGIRTEPFEHYFDDFVRRLDNFGLKKGIIINEPNLLKYAGYYNRDYKAELIKVMETYQSRGIFWVGGTMNQYPDVDYNKLKNDPEMRVLGNTYLDTLIGKNVNINLKVGLFPEKQTNSDYNIGQFDKYSSFYLIDSYNKSLSVYAEYLNVPIFDLNDLYRKVSAGEYLTQDGIKVSGKWPEGNFFSVDGIYPSEFGQAVIANEIIKTINSFYKTEIPLISTREFLQK